MAKEKNAWIQRRSLRWKTRDVIRKSFRTTLTSERGASAGINDGRVPVNRTAPDPAAAHYFHKWLNKYFPSTLNDSACTITYDSARVFPVLYHRCRYYNAVSTPYRYTRSRRLAALNGARPADITWPVLMNLLCEPTKGWASERAESEGRDFSQVCLRRENADHECSKVHSCTRNIVRY